MYTSHFKFNAQPFQICTDPRFLWLGEQHKEALAILQYGIQENKGVIALSGGVGTGKTTLINALMSRIKGDVIAAVVSDPDIKPMDFFYYIANLFGITSRENSKADFLFHFIAFLKNSYLQNKKVLLIIDEAQRLKANLLEELRLLSNIEHSGERLLNVFLVGQNEMNIMLLKPENRSLKQRIAVQFNIAPLKLDDVYAYIYHRLNMVGCEKRIFTDGAINEIFAFSKGCPRLINVICDQSLISAFVKNSQKVTADMVASSANEFEFPNKKPSNPPISNDVVTIKAVKTIARPSIRANFHKENKRNRSKNETVFSSFRLAYIGLILALIIFSGYLLYQYRMGYTPFGSEPLMGDGQNYQSVVIGEKSPLENDQFGLPPSRQARAVQIPEQRDDEKTENKDAKPQRGISKPSHPPKKPVTAKAVADKPPIMKDSTRRSTIFTGSIILPTESPRTPRSEKVEGELNVQAAVPSIDGTDPSVMFSDSNGPAALPAADAFRPPLSYDKDPGAIIEWLIQNKKNHPRE